MCVERGIAIAEDSETVAAKSETRPSDALRRDGLVRFGVDFPDMQIQKRYCGLAVAAAPGFS